MFYHAPVEEGTVVLQVERFRTRRAAAAAAPRPVIDPLVWRVGTITVLGSVMSVLDTTIVNVALEPLARDLNSSLTDISWIVTAYLLAIAAIVPVTGWASRRIGTRRLYLLSLVLFTFGSVLCGLAWSTPTLVAARVVQGLGGGLLMPVGQMITVRVAGGKHLGQVMGVLAVPTVLAPVFGPTVGGLLLERVGWQSIFLINVPIGIVAVVLGLRVLPHDRPESAAAAGRLDVVGLVLVAGGLSLLTWGLSETGTQGSLTSRLVVGPVVVGLLLVIAYVWHGLRTPSPLLDLRLFARPAYAAASLGTFVTSAVSLGALILMPLYFQGPRGEDALTAGLLMSPTAIGVVVVLRAAGRWTDRIGGGRVALVGGALLVAGTVPFLLLDATSPYWPYELAMLVRGLGVGMLGMPLITAALSVLHQDAIGDAAAQLNVIQRVGGSMGTALFAVLLQRRIGGGDRVAAASAFGWTWGWVLAATALSLVPVAVLARIEHRARLAGDTEPVLHQALEPV